MAKIIDKINKRIDEDDFDKDTVGTMVGLVGQLRGLFDQIKKEQSADADRAAIAGSGVNVLIANPKQLDLNSELISELILTMRHDLGGICELFKFDILEVHELEKLKKVIDKLIKEKIDGLLETEIIEEDDEDE